MRSTFAQLVSCDLFHWYPPKQCHMAHRKVNWNQFLRRTKWKSCAPWSRDATRNCIKESLGGLEVPMEWISAFGIKWIEWLWSCDVSRNGSFSLSNENKINVMDAGSFTLVTCGEWILMRICTQYDMGYANRGKIWVFMAKWHFTNLATHDGKVGITNTWKSIWFDWLMIETSVAQNVPYSM